MEGEGANVHTPGPRHPLHGHLVCSLGSPSQGEKDIEPGAGELPAGLHMSVGSGCARSPVIIRGHSREEQRTELPLSHGLLCCSIVKEIHGRKAG